MPIHVDHIDNHFYVFITKSIYNVWWFKLLISHKLWALHCWIDLKIIKNFTHMLSLL